MKQDRATAHLTITVSSLTRKRPAMVKALVESWGAMDVPDNCTVICLIVENDTAPETQALIEGMNPLPNGLAQRYVLEPEPGIPFGRNRAAKEAIANGSDLLVFADDDEVVAKDWLVRLVAGYRAGEAVLLGAPLRTAPPLDGLSKLEQIMHANIAARYTSKERRAASLASLNATPRVTVVTNNWMGETRLFSEAGIWFDESMRYTGGTDSKLCAEVKDAGYTVGWVKDAYVYETIPRDRLSFGYQFARARDQANTHFHRKMQAKPIALYGLILHLPTKTIAALALLIALPLTGGKTLLKLARTTGWMVGRIGAAFGTRSKLYTNITGD